MNEVTAICQECGKQFEYVLRPGFPRKYCPECSEIKKASYEAQQTGNVPVVKPGEPQKVAQNGSKHATMYTSYAKDIFCELIKQQPPEPLGNKLIWMEDAIKLVKQAKEAFE